MTITLEGAGAPLSSTPSRPRRGIGERWSRIVRPPRVAGLDVARALAVVGMIAAHVGNAPQLVVGDPGTWAGVVHGRSSLLFALVAGVSIALMTRGVRTAPADEVRRTRLALVGRGVVVLGLGVLLELVGSPVAIILGFYGILFIIVAPIVGWSTRRLLLLVAVLVVVLGPLVSLAKATYLLGGSAAQLVLLGMYPLPVWLALVLTGLVVGRGDLGSLRRAGAMVAVGIVLCVAGYGGATLLAPADADAPSVEEPSDPGSSLVEVPGEDVDLAGFTCTRQDEESVSCWRTAGATVEAPVPGSVTSGSTLVELDSAASFGWSVDPADGWWRSPLTTDSLTWDAVRGALVSAEPHSGGLGEVVGSGGFVLATLGLCLALGRPRVLRQLLVPVAALGSMPLTVYSLHVMSFLVPRFVEPAGIGTWLAQTVVLLLAATLWALMLGKGPLERMTAWVASRYAVRTSGEKLRMPSDGGPGRPHLPGPPEVP